MPWGPKSVYHVTFWGHVPVMGATKKVQRVEGMKVRSGLGVGE